MSYLKMGISMETALSSKRALLLLKHCVEQDGSCLFEYFTAGIEYIQHGIDHCQQPVQDHGEYVKKLALFFFDCYAGLVIPGNSDNIYPAFFKGYAGPLPPPDFNLASHRRHQLEIALVQEALKCGKPVLGICGGHQIINVALGGVVKDLSALTSSKELPKVKEAFLCHEDQNKMGEQVAYLSGTRLQTIVQQFKSLYRKKEAGQAAYVYYPFEEKPIVSYEVSFHTQAIDVEHLPSSIIQSAIDPDGIVKAIEVAEHPWMIGTQFHPEWFDVSGSDCSQAIFKDFIRACWSAVHKKALLQALKESSWTERGVKAAHKKKYQLLKRLYDEVNEKTVWAGKAKKVTMLFRSSSPQGILLLRKRLSMLEASQPHSTRLNQLFREVKDLLNEKAKPYQGWGKRDGSVDAFYKVYREQFNAVDDCSVRMQARLKKIPVTDHQMPSRREGLAHY